MAKKVNQKINGKEYYRIRVMIGVDRSGKKLYKAFYGRNKTDAELMRDEYLKNLKLGISSKGKSTLLQVSMEDWLLNNIKKSGIKESSFQKYYEDFNRYINGSSIGKMPVSSVRASHIQKHLNDLADEKTTNLVRTIYKYIKRYFEYALAINFVERSPIHGVVLPEGAKSAKSYTEEDYEEPFTLEEKSNIIDAARKKNPMYGDVIYLLFKFGCRRGEVLALTEDNVNFKDGSFQLFKSISKVKTYDSKGNSSGYGFILSTPKTKQSIRVNYMDEESKRVLKKAIIRQKKLALKLGKMYQNEKCLIFTSELGNPIDPKNLWEFWGRILMEESIPYRRMHSTRSTFVTECYEKGIDEPTTQKIIGHGPGSKITSTVYRKVRNKDFKENMLKAIQN